MIENIKNISLIDQDPFDSFFVRTIEKKQLDKFSRGQSNRFFGDPNADFLEFSVYDQQNELVEWQTTGDFRVDEEGILLISTYKNLNALTLLNETGYVLRYNFHRKVYFPNLPENFDLVFGPRRRQLLRRNLGSNIGMKLFVDEISQNRREIRLLPKKIGSEAYDIPFLETFVSFFSESATNQEFDYVLNFGNNQIFHIVNWTLDKSTYPEYPFSVVLKTYEEIPESLEASDECWVNEEVFPSYIDRTRFIQTEDEDPQVQLRGPNFNLEVDQTDFRDTGVQTWETLLDSDEQTSGEAFDAIFSQEEQTELNVDYSDFSNFVKFSSAKERVLNFEYKLKVYERITNEIDELLSGATSTGEVLNPQRKQQLQTARDRRSTLESGFDGFERYLFERDEIRDGQGDLLDVSSSAVQTFIENFKQDADLYDRNNPANLQSNLPEYIRLDDRNDSYLLFVSMIGHYFDIIFTYIKHMQYLQNRAEDIDEVESLSKDLTQFISNSLGFEAYNGFSEQDLQKVMLSGDNEASDVQKQIWRRVLNNIPYLNKSKGTRRSIEALISLYGIPKIGLTIREYGGGSDKTDPGFFEYEDETSALEFFGNQSIDIDWTFPDDKVSSFEIRWRSEYVGSSDLTLVDFGSLGDIILKKTNDPSLGDEYGLIEVNIGGDTETIGFDAPDFRVPIFDGNFNSLVIDYDRENQFYEVYFGKLSEIGPYEFDDPKTAEDGVTWSDTLFLNTGTDLNLPSTVSVGPSFIGDIDYVNVWREPLPKEKFLEHVLAPYKYDYDNESFVLEESQREDLTSGINRFLYVHIDFDDNQVVNASENLTFPYTGNITNSGWTNISEDFINYNRLNYVKPLKIGSNANSSSKVRIEDSSLFGPLSPDNKRERGEFDQIGKDSNKIGVYFSPNEAVNQDITASIGYNDLNDLLADPKSLRKEEYPPLNTLNKKYWQKYPTKVNKDLYFRYIDQFNRAFFKQLENLIPARSSLTYGSLLEPHFLERYRVKNTRVQREELDKETGISISDTILAESNYSLENVKLNVPDKLSQSGSYPTYDKGVGADVFEYSKNTFRFAGNLLDSTRGQTRQALKLYPNQREFYDSLPKQNADLRVFGDGSVELIDPPQNQTNDFGFVQSVIDPTTVRINPQGIYDYIEPFNFTASATVVSTILGSQNPAVSSVSSYDLPGKPNYKAYKRYRRVPFRQTTKFINPITERFNYYHNNYFQVFGFGDLYGEALYGQGVYSTLTSTDLVSTPFGDITPPSRPYEPRRHYIFTREFRTAQKNSKYRGAVWNNDVDGPAVQITETTSDRLIVSPSDREKGEGPTLDTR